MDVLMFVIEPFCNRVILLTYLILSIAVLKKILNHCLNIRYTPTSTFEPLVRHKVRVQRLNNFQELTMYQTAWISKTY